jgi:hypothetical protein
MQRLFLCALSLILAAPPAGADSVKLRGRQVFENVRIETIEAGRLVFRGVSGETLRKPLASVEWLECTQVPKLSEAEAALAENRPSEACAKLKELAAAREPEWLARWAAVRLIVSLDAAGRLDEALAVYLSSRRLGDYATLPSRCGFPGSPENRAALRRLDALRRIEGPDAGELRRLRLELHLIEDTPSLPRDLQSDSANEAAASAPDAQPPLLFGASSPPSEVQPQLTDKSMVLSVSARLLESGAAEKAVRMVQRGLPYAEPAARAAWRIELGRGLLAAGGYPAALKEFLDVAHADCEPGLAAEALWGAGQAHERGGRADLARDIFSQLSTRPGLAESLRSQVAEALSRLAAQSQPSASP